MTFKMAFVIYWMMGCFAVGMAIGAHINKCPADHFWRGSDIFGLVATWPIAFSLALSLDQPHNSTCENH